MRSGLRLLGASVVLFAIALAVTISRAAAVAASSPVYDLSSAPSADSLSSALSAPSADGLSSADYTGSAACARCHQEDYDQWKQSLHVRMTRPIAEAEVVGDFGNASLTAHGRSFVFTRDNGKPAMRISFGGRAPENFAVDYTLGFKRYQGYLSTLPDGRMYVLPAFWHVETRRWIDWKEITPVPDDAHGLRQIWNSNCFNCHATNLSRGFDVASKTFKTSWTEMGIGCEACHGPGRRHIELIDAAQKEPSLKPGGTLEIYTSTSGTPRQSFDTCGYCHGNKNNVFARFTAGSRYEDFALPFLISAPIPDTDLQGEFWPDGRPNRFNRTQALTLSGCFKAGEIACTSCHAAHGSPNPFSLRVDITQGSEGDTLCTQCHRNYQLTTTNSQPSVDSQALIAAGRELKAESRELKAESRELRAESRELEAESRELEAESRELKAESRELKAESRELKAVSGIERHTFHAASSPGSRCINCHMSDVNWRLLIRRRDHTFQAPVPEITAAFGVPNACTTCHDEKSPEWAARQMDEWWANGERRRAQLSVADTMYRAGSGDPSVIPELARLAVDRSQGLLIRASAVEFIGQFAAGTAGATSANAQSQTSFVGPKAPGVRPQAPAIGPSMSDSGGRMPVQLTPAQVNALIGAAADPEAVVRAHAVTALLATGEHERIILPLTARLTDSARVVRVRVAEGLLALGVADLPGAAGALLAKAQDEYAAALMEFNDLPANHAALGWLLAERNRVAEAQAALDDAIALDPKSARPYVIKGVIAARGGKFAEAAGLWRKAKSVDPAYPNIDQLIAEADKRKQ